MAVVIGVVGGKKSGKTSLLEDLIRELRSRGYSVAAIKHASHELDIPGKDTHRLREAGANVVCAISGDLTAIYTDEIDLDDLLKQLESLDFVLLEGFSSRNDIPKVVVGEFDRDLENVVGRLGGEIRDLNHLIEILENMKKVNDILRDLPGADCGLCGFETCRELAERVARGEKVVCRFREIEILVDGRKIPMNKFVRNLTARVIEALLDSLKNTEGRRIQIELRRTIEERSETLGDLIAKRSLERHSIDREDSDSP